MSIKVLSAEIVNQISAGEVVERPAHLVKELVENSLDAKSTILHIEVGLGGRYIKISDNGDGITSDELELALTRHATSKINKTDDLWDLSSYGFRGEALASAAAVSKLILISKTNSSDQASMIENQFGVLSEIKPAYREKGTEIIISDLFQNVPARLKFLKSDAVEFSQIRSVVKAMAMAYYKVEFKLIVNNKLDFLYYPKTEQVDRVREVLEQKNIYHHIAARGSYQAEAFFCSPYDVAKNSKNIWLFAQDRWIQDRGLQAAVGEAYRSLLMHGEFPICAVFLKCKPDEIDVNIHPTKSQVKFSDASFAFRAVQASLREALEKAPWNSASTIEVASKISTLSMTENLFLSENKFELNLPKENLTFTDFKNEKIQFKKKNFNPSSNDLFPTDSLKKLAVEKDNVFFPEDTDNKFWSRMDVVGQINNTYIVCQLKDKMVLVDQHAAHERVAFEKLMFYWKNRNNPQEDKKFDIQNHLFPLAIDLSEEKIEVLIQVKEDLFLMGIEIERLGPTVIGLKSGPTFIKDSVYPFVFEKMSRELIDHGGSLAMERIIIDLFATMACHSVIRAGQSLSESEMRQLLVEMDQFPLSSFCPHGRPVSIDFSFYEIEKKFGRIV